MAVPIRDFVPPTGWFVLDVMRKEIRKGDWVALLIDVCPGDLATCSCDFPARFYIHPKEYCPGPRIAHQCWLRIPGKHRSRKAAWSALEDMLATRH